MAFTGTQHANVQDATFNDVGRNQYIFQTTNIQLPSSPQLEQAFSSARLISSAVPHIDMSREQMTALSMSINTLLLTLDAEFSVGRLLETRTAAALGDLNKSVPT